MYHSSGNYEAFSRSRPDDLVFMTIGSLTENSDNGDHHTPANLNVGPAPACDLWRRIAAKDPAFGHPEVFGSHIPEIQWESATGRRSINASRSTSRKSPGAITVPVMMPYVTAFFMPRQAGDRPDVAPDGAVNFAFIGKFA